MATESYHPLFAVDLATACAYYDSIAGTLGNRFRANVRSIIQTVVERPESFGRIGGEFRGALVDRFPYVVVFTVDDDLPPFSACDTQHRTAVIGSVAQCQQRAANHPMHLSRRVGAIRQWKINRADRVIGNVRPKTVDSATSPTTPLFENRYVSKLKKPILGVMCVFAVFYLATWFVYRPDKTTQDFADHVYRARYHEAADMLTATCSIKLETDGGLTLVDRAGKSTVVPPAQLPFKVGGGRPDASGDFSMTALGNSTNGRLDAPAIIMYLTVEGGKVCIDHVNLSMLLSGIDIASAKRRKRFAVA